MGDPKDAEIGLLSQQVKSTSTVLPEHVSRTAKIWAMMLLIFIGLLAVILTMLHIENNTPGLTFKSRRDSLKAPLNVLVVGDWGREGHYNQSRVARQMGRVGAEMDVNFIISSGDNFYGSGLDGIDDVLFETSFSQIYQAPSLQKMWYAVLGNHDYRGNPEVQVNKSLQLRDSRWYCDYMYTLPIDLEASQTVSRSYVEFFFIDTNPMEEYYWTPNNTHYTWTRSIPREAVITNQLKNLTNSLEASKAIWKVVVGHQTMFSHGYHGNTPELIAKVLPILKANEVDLYINGHDHCLQDVKRSDSNIHFVTSGAGSKAWAGHLPPPNIEDSKFFYDGQGFISLSLSTTILQVNFYDITGSILHQIELKKESLKGGGN